MALSSRSDSIHPSPRRDIWRSQTSVASYYDDLGVREWLRLETDSRARVILHRHKSVLSDYIHRGCRVLDAGCGPGRFALELEVLGAQVVAGDLSSSQLELARQTLRHSHPPIPLVRLTVSHLPFAPESFDAVVCFGAVLSHLGDAATEAVRELVRVLRPGGILLVSVQAAGNYHLPRFVELARTRGIIAADGAVLGSLESVEAGVPWRAFAASEIVEIAAATGCEVVSLSASNVLATVEQIPLLDEIENDAVLWQAFLRWEEHLARLSRNVDRGAFIIAVLKKRAEG